MVKRNIGEHSVDRLVNRESPLGIRRTSWCRPDWFAANHGHMERIGRRGHEPTWLRNPAHPFAAVTKELVMATRDCLGNTLEGFLGRDESAANIHNLCGESVPVGHIGSHTTALNRPKVLLWGLALASHMKAESGQLDAPRLGFLGDCRKPFQGSPKLFTKGLFGTTVCDEESDKGGAGPASVAQLGHLLHGIYYCERNTHRICELDVLGLLTGLGVDNLVWARSGDEGFLNLTTRGAVKSCRRSGRQHPAKKVRVIVAFHGVVGCDPRQMGVPEANLGQQGRTRNGDEGLARQCRDGQRV